MINKKMIIVIAIFIATGFLVFSFAATPQGETVDNNSGTTNNSTNDKNNNDNKNSTNSSKDKDKDKDTKKDNDIIGTPIGSLDNQNNGQNISLDNNGNQWAGGNNGATIPGGNTGGQTGGNTGTTTPGDNTGGQTGGNTEDDKPNEPSKPDEPSEPDINVDELTGPSVFESADEGIDTTVENGNVVIYKGVVEKSNVDDFGVYYINVIVRAPYKYSQDVLKGASIVTPYGEKYNAGFLQYDSEGYAYFSIPQGFINGVSSELSLTVNWGVGENIVYTLKSNINVVD